MKLHDYDSMLDLIEANITLEKDELAELIKRRFVLDERSSAEYFQIINEKQRTLRQYIVERKACHALADFVDGKTMEQVSEKYNYEQTSLRKAMINYDKEHRSPKRVREAGFELPAPVYLKQIVSGEQVSATNNITDNNTAYLKEIMALIDENTLLRDALSGERRKSRAITSNTKMEAFSKEKYDEFLELENLRVSYGFSVKDILALQKKSEETGKPLKELCNEKLDTLFFADPEYDLDSFGFDEIERLEYRNTYEMDTAEAWNLYYNDDGYENTDPDFFAEESDEYYGSDDISDAELEEQYMQQDDDYDYDPGEMEDLIDPDSKFA